MDKSKKNAGKKGKKKDFGFSDLKEEFESSENVDSENSTSDTGGLKGTGGPESQDINERLINVGSISGPVVLLIGPASSGKTVSLIRLMTYLKQQGNYVVEPNAGFISDPNYKDVVNNFQTNNQSLKYNPTRTGNIHFMLLDVFKNSDLYCQVLEAPGEHYFSESDPMDKAFKNYLTQILFNSAYQKVLVFFFEQSMLSTDGMQRAYADRLAHIIRNINPSRDRVLLLFNKVDQLQGYISGGKVNDNALKKLIYDNPNYGSLVNAIKKNRSMKPVRFVSFSGGTFHKTKSNGKETWALSEDRYPECMWSKISDVIKKKRRLF